jgi:hypothetical protein
MVMAILIGPEWWDWAMLIVIPLLFLLFVFAVWSIVSGLAGIIREARSTSAEHLFSRTFWDSSSTFPYGSEERAHQRLGSGNIHIAYKTALRCAFA